jgi:hypothetical protein
MTTVFNRDNEDDSSCGSELSLENTRKAESTVEDKSVIAAKETREVRQVKCVIIIVVFMSVLGALAVFFYSKRAEQQLFEKSFYSDANKVLASLEKSIERSLVSQDNLAMATVISGRAANQKFPFVAVPGFAELVAKLAPLVGAHMTSYYPIVRFGERAEWELFASGNNVSTPLFVQETIQFQEQYPFYYGPKVDTYTWQYRNTIYRDNFTNSPPFSDQPNFSTTRPGLLDIYLPSFHRFPLVMNYLSPANWGKFTALKFS